MKELNVLIIFLIVFVLTSCQNDVKTDVVEKSVVVEDTSNIETSVGENKENENIVEKKLDIKESKKSKELEKKPVIVEEIKEKEVKEVIKPKKGEINMIEETAEDLEKEVNVKVARVVNPDNDNGSFEIKEDATITVVPVLTAEDKGKYYVQFKIKVSKISKSDLAKFFPESQKIYVVQHQGLYKYCVGQFDNEEDAKAYKKKVDKEFGFKSSEVASYSDAW